MQLHPRGFQFSVFWVFAVIHDETNHTRNGSYSYMTWLIHVSHDSFEYMTKLIHIWQNSFIYDKTSIVSASRRRKRRREKKQTQKHSETQTKTQTHTDTHTHTHAHTHTHTHKHTCKNMYVSVICTRSSSLLLPFTHKNSFPRCGVAIVGRGHELSAW